MKHLGKAIGVSMIAFSSIAAAQDTDLGQSMYMQYCATCHGEDGAGAGPLTELMIEKPADLRLLAENNVQAPGEFPMLHVLHVIDGRTGLRAHGGSMPTYGDVFDAGAEPNRLEYGALLETRGRILSLALYLESMQN